MCNAKRERHSNKIALNLTFEVHRYFHDTTHMSVLKTKFKFYVTIRKDISFEK